MHVLVFGNVPSGVPVARLAVGDLLIRVARAFGPDFHIFQAGIGSQPEGPRRWRIKERERDEINKQRQILIKERESACTRCLDPKGFGVSPST
jgi:hypothetical protein